MEKKKTHNILQQNGSAQLFQATRSTKSVLSKVLTQDLWQQQLRTKSYVMVHEVISDHWRRVFPPYSSSYSQQKDQSSNPKTSSCHQGIGKSTVILYLARLMLATKFVESLLKKTKTRSIF